MLDPTFMFFDIETLRTDRQEIVDALTASVKPPGNCKSESAKEKWMNDGRYDAAVRKKLVDTCFDGGTGRIAALSWGLGTDSVYAGHAAGPNGHDTEIEKLLLQTFFDDAANVIREYRAEPTLVGHYISSFDIRFIWKRCIVLGILCPEWWPIDVKPWDRNRIRDTNVEWTGGANNHISQDLLAQTLGVHGKSEISGSHVDQLWEDGRYDDVRDYCADDVMCNREIFCRMNFEDAPEAEEFDTDTVLIEGRVNSLFGPGRDAAFELRRYGSRKTLPELEFESLDETDENDI